MKKPAKPSSTPAPAEKAPASQAAEAASDSQTAMLKLAAAHRVNVAFSQIVTLMMRHQSFRNHFIAELEWMLVPAVATGQFLITDYKDPQSGIPIPVAAVIWARVSPDVDKRLQASKSRPKLAPAEWASGNIPWLVDAIGEPKETAKLVKHLAEVMFAKDGLRAVERGPDGSGVVRVLGGSGK